MERLVRPRILVRGSGFALLAVLLVGTVLEAPQAHADGPWPDLTALPAGGGGGSADAALVVGVDDYIFAPDVPGAATNAKKEQLSEVKGEIRESLRNKKFFAANRAVVDELQAAARIERRE